MGYIGKDKKLIDLVKKLKLLEYRGYDSWGYSTKNELNKYIGEVDINKINEEKLTNNFIGQSRWATHGEVSVKNAHPHIDCNDNYRIVHNGIIENYLELKKGLEEKGHKFISDTDTEVIAHLIEEKRKTNTLLYSILNTIKELKGSFAVVVQICNKLIAFKRGDLSLLVGIGTKGFIITSDILGFDKEVFEYFDLKDNEIIMLNEKNIALYEDNGDITDLDERRLINFNYNVNIDKGEYPHYMLKEIMEQSNIIINSKKYITHENFNALNDLFYHINKVYIIGCGSAYHAGFVGKYLLERNTDLEVEVDVASEFRYREFNIKKNSLVIAISQSGETADTIASVKRFKKAGLKVLAICNTKDSTIDKLADYTLLTDCGKEIAVASTKSYIAQLLCLYRLSKFLNLSMESEIDDNSLEKLSKLLDDKKYINSIKSVAKSLYKSDLFFFLGRGINYPTVLEGALKLKEVAYVHSEACSAGEIKHGTIALVDNKTSSVCILIKDDLYDKMWSNIQEIKARGTNIIMISDTENKDITKYNIKIPKVIKELTPISATITLQLLAYYIALYKGCPIDKPRNLAKSVTVE